MADLVRIPLGFYVDRSVDRLLPVPPLVRHTKRHGWIDPANEHVPSMIADAEYYADPKGLDCPGIVQAARGFLRALRGASVRCPGYAQSATFDGSPGRYCIHCGTRREVHR